VKKSLVISAAVLIALIAVITGARVLGTAERVVYTLEPVTRGPIERVVVTTGTLEALNTVIVGSQLSGQLAAIYADFNQSVQEGELLAQIDPRTFAARVEQSRADVAVAEATIVQRRAELTRARAQLAQAERDLARRKSLHERGHISAADLEIDLTNAQVNEASVAVAAGAVANAEANLDQRRSALQQAQLDLERTEIRAPITGTVVNRTVQQGQTVAASLQAPELFQIAQDLHFMKVEASVDEADIGRIREGFAVRFSVDAYPERTFQGRVTQVRIAPDRLLNVVSYRVIITTGNDDLALLPGMTANVEVILDNRANVLRVPNAALRFVPKDVQPPAPEAPAARTAAGPDAGRALVWLLDGSRPVARPVTTGLGDDQFTEVLEGLAEGDSVIVRASREPDA